MALVLDYAGPLAGHWAPRLGRSVPADWELVPSHFSERLQLFVILALGETIVAAGVSASELEMDAMRIAAVVVSFGVSVAFWWLYFDYHAKGVAQELQARDAERGRLGELLSYLHVPMVAGIIVSAVATELVIAHPTERLHIDELLPLAAEPALSWSAACSSRRASCTRSGGQRLVAAVAILVVTVRGVRHGAGRLVPRADRARWSGALRDGEAQRHGEHRRVAGLRLDTQPLSSAQ